MKTKLYSFFTHPQYQNNNIDNNQMEMTKFDLTES